MTHARLPPQDFRMKTKEQKTGFIYDFSSLTLLQFPNNFHNASTDTHTHTHALTRTRAWVVFNEDTLTAHNRQSCTTRRRTLTFQKVIWSNKHLLLNTTQISFSSFFFFFWSFSPSANVTCTYTHIALICMWKLVTLCEPRVLDILRALVHTTE